ncbi:hypothetical protein ACMHYB_01640 [Sorangium sp. So ce1128]
MTMETRQLKETGLLTSTAVARMLGIGKTTLRRLEGKLFEPAPRQGSRKMRVSMDAGELEWNGREEAICLVPAVPVRMRVR